MSAKIIPLGNITSLDLPADRILENNIGELESVILIGYHKDGSEFFASSIADGGTVLWLLERLKLQLLTAETSR